MSDYPQQYISQVEAAIDIRRLFEVIGFHSSKLQETDEEFRAFCPIHQDVVFRTMIVSKKTRSFRCTYARCDGQKGGGLIQLYAVSRKLPFDSALQMLLNELGIKIRPPADPEHIRKNLEFAENYLMLEYFEEAGKLFADLLESQPDLTRALEGLLLVYVKTGNRQGELEVREKLGQLLLKQGQNTEALEHGRQVAEEQPDSIEAHQLLAECLAASADNEAAMWEFMTVADMAEAAGDLETAANAYLRVAEIDFGTDIIDVNPHLVRVYIQQGKRDQAVQYLADRARELQQTGNLPRAAELYSFAVEQDDTRHDLRLKFLECALGAPVDEQRYEVLMGEIDKLAAAGHTTEAAGALRKASEQRPNDRGLLEKLFELQKSAADNDVFSTALRLSRLYVTLGDGPGALTLLRDTINLGTPPSELVDSLFHLELKHGDASAALALRLQKVRSLVAEKNFEGALNEIDTLLTHGDTVPMLLARAELLETWGGEDPARMREAIAAYERTGDFAAQGNDRAQAVQYYEKAVSIGEPGPGVLEKLARNYLHLGRQSEALDALVNHCEALCSAGRMADAISDAESFVPLLGGHSDLIRYVADLYMRHDAPETAVEKLRALADTMAAEGNLKEARDTYENALRIIPDDIPTLTSMAELFHNGVFDAMYPRTIGKIAEAHEKASRPTEAIALLDELASDRPEELWAVEKLIELCAAADQPDIERRWRLHLASFYREMGNHDGEARILEQGIARDPDNEDLLALLAANQFARGASSAAVETTCRLAFVLRERGQSENASAALERALEQAPDHIELNRHYFSFLCADGRTNEAAMAATHFVDLLAAANRTADIMQVFDQLLACGIDGIEVRKRRIEFLQSIGKDQEAATQRTALAADLRERGDVESAESVLLEILEEDSQNIPAREELVSVYEVQERAEDVQRQLELLAEAYYNGGRTSDAVNSIRAMIQLNPQNEEARRLLVRYLGACENTEDAVRELYSIADHYRRLGNEDAAVEVEIEAANAAPEDKEALSRLVASLRRNNRHAEAADALLQMAETQVRCEQNAEAIETLTEVLDIDPRNIEARRMRADLFAAVGDQTRALEEFRILSTDLAAGDPKKESSGIHRQAGSTLQLVPEYDFEHYVVGGNNNFAYATAMAVARAPAQTYNPLFLYSDVGLGKTHLCNAIANFMLKKDPRTRVIYTNSEDFTNQLVAAIQTNSIGHFRARFKNLDLLIVDDVQFLAGKERAQEEFFHIFNTLFQAKRQIVVTSDRPPKDIAHLEARLRTRFAAGAIVDIASPDLETRMAILNRQIEMDRIDMEPSIRALIAERIDTNVRELKGALNQAIALRDLRGYDLNEENVGKMLESYYIKT